MKWLRPILISLIVILLLAYAGISYYFSTLIVETRHRTLEEAIASAERFWGKSFEEVAERYPDPETFTVQGVDDLTLVGWYFDNPAEESCGMVLGHGWTSTRVSMLRYGYIFWGRGCDVVVYDHRGHGESEGDFGSGGVKESEDMLIVVDWLADRAGLTRSQIGVGGTSWGAAAALQAGAKADVAFVMADSSFQDWESAIMERAVRQFGDWIRIFSPGAMSVSGMRSGVQYRQASPMLAASDIEEPVFLIHSTGDTATDSQQSVNIAANLHPDNSVFYHTNWGSEHSRDFTNRPDEYTALVNAFIDQFVGDYGKSPAP